MAANQKQPDALEQALGRSAGELQSSTGRGFELLDSQNMSVKDILLSTGTNSQKAILGRALDFVSQPHEINSKAITAVRAYLIIEWLRDINWTSEATELQERAEPFFWKTVEEGSASTLEIQILAQFLSWHFGFTLVKGDWQSTQGSDLVEELWTLIELNTQGHDN